QSFEMPQPNRPFKYASDGWQSGIDFLRLRSHASHHAETGVAIGFLLSAQTGFQRADLANMQIRKSAAFSGSSGNALPLIRVQSAYFQNNST
ncbi:MAG: hypothetical protein WCG50_15480, partial [Rhodoferax sp.]|uniref:hypothetical protein n=1 Tax=Rhodoferax sp. TaxID=50421 RepID=UPI003019E5A6